MFIWRGDQEIWEQGRQIWAKERWKRVKECERDGRREKQREKKWKKRKKAREIERERPFQYSWKNGAIAVVCCGNKAIFIGIYYCCAWMSSICNIFLTLTACISFAFYIFSLSPTAVSVSFYSVIFLCLNFLLLIFVIFHSSIPSTSTCCNPCQSLLENCFESVAFLACSMTVTSMIYRIWIICIKCSSRTFDTATSNSSINLLWK